MKVNWTNKEWFILVNGKQQGPYTLRELAKHPEFTPDTLVWRKGFLEWIRARFVPEMKEVFRDPPRKKKDKEEPFTSKPGMQDFVVLTLQQDPYQFLLWVLLVLLLLYSFYRYYYFF